MGFRLRQDAMVWFGRIRDRHPFKIQWDVYYFCLMIGLQRYKKSPLESVGVKSDEFIRGFPSHYQQSQYFLIGLLLEAEAVSLGLELTEKERVRKQIRDMVDPDSPTKLSEEGERIMNDYASGGFDELLKEQPDPPYSALEFFNVYREILHKT